VHERHLERGADGGQRAAQLVRRVGDERPLPRPARLEPVEHAVERLGQPAHLVLAAGHRQPPRRVGRGHRLRADAELLDRPQGPADGQPDASGGGQQQEREAHEQRRPDQPQRVVDRLDGDAGEHHRAGARAPGVHPQRVAVADAVTVHGDDAVVDQRLLDLGRCQQRHDAAGPGGRRQDPALRVQHLHQHRRVRRRDQRREAPLDHQLLHLSSTLAGPLVDDPGQPSAQGGHQQQRPGQQRDGDRGGDQHGHPGLQAGPVPPLLQPAHAPALTSRD
jgi:hypothetical protein